MLRLSKAHLKRIIIAVVLLAVLVAVTGCKTIGFYAQAIKGQYQLFAAREPMSKLAEDPRTPEELKQRFELVNDIRQFAERELALPVRGHYKAYADVGRPFVLWNVQAAPEFSMQPKRWWYPLVGRQKYRGYFQHASATNYAAALRRGGKDVFVGGVQAYSTLGWFKEPVLNTFIFDPDPMVAELIFHELSHQEVFARGDTDFNEAFATTVGQEGARRWLKARGRLDELATYERDLARNEQFVSLVLETRAELEKLYGDRRTREDEIRATDAFKDVPREEMRRRKTEVYEKLKSRYEDLKAEWDGDTSYDLWFSRQLNNAKLNSVAAYYRLVPGFEALLELNDGDLKEFYAAAQRLADMPRKERRDWLQTLAISSQKEIYSGEIETPPGQGVVRATRSPDEHQPPG
jgi:predicted aminopeptidase